MDSNQETDKENAIRIGNETIANLDNLVKKVRDGEAIDPSRVGQAIRAGSLAILQLTRHADKDPISADTRAWILTRIEELSRESIILALKSKPKKKRSLLKKLLGVSNN